MHILNSDINVLDNKRWYSEKHDLWTVLILMWHNLFVNWKNVKKKKTKDSVGWIY